MIPSYGISVLPIRNIKTNNTKGIKQQLFSRTDVPLYSRSHKKE